MNISEDTYKELIKAQQKLNALECAGVDNWDGYDFALEEFRAAEEREELIQDIYDDILSIVGEHIEEPAGCGAGFGVNPTCNIKLTKYLTKLLQKVPSKELVRE
jgi:hypothetical protein